MATKTLIERIERLPPTKRAKVEEFVESLSSASKPLFSRELLDSIKQEHEALAREHGSIETDDLLRELREDGGR